MAQTMSNVRHTYPLGDLIEHDTSGPDCVCGPAVELVRNDDGTDAGWLYIHHSLDGREKREQAQIIHRKVGFRRIY
jgi:hypothetical protein